MNGTYRGDGPASDPRTAGPESARKVAIVVLASLPLGVTLFAVIALWIAARGDPEPGLDVLYPIWAATTVATILGAAIVWRRKVRPLLPRTGRYAEPRPPETLRRLQTGLIICMALIEGSALFGGVVTLIGGGALPAVAGVLLIWAALAVAWPRRAWYGLR